MQVARPVRRADRRNSPIERSKERSGPTLHKRIATRALRLLSDWVLNSCGFVRLELLIEVENEKSKATAANAGYRSNYEVKKEAWSDGASRDVVIYTRTA